MKKITFSVIIFLIIGLLASCSKDDSSPAAPAPTTGTISGKITLPAGAGGDIVNTRVAIYQSYDDWNNDRVLKTCACASDGSFSLAEVTPGSYYLDAWKDNNNNTRIDTGDFYGVFGNSQPTPFSVAAGQTMTANATVYPVP